MSDKRSRPWVSDLRFSESKGIRIWYETIVYSNQLMHTSAVWSKGKNLIATSLGAHPDIIRPLDARAAELLQAAQDAHDTLLAYLKTRVQDG